MNISIETSDFLGRLSCIDSAGDTLGEYHYDHKSQRIKKTSPTGSEDRYFIHDQFGHLISEYKPIVLGWEADYVYLYGQPLAKIVEHDEGGIEFLMEGNFFKPPPDTLPDTLPDTSQTMPATDVYYFHNDHLGMPHALTNESAVIEWQGYYYPFGEIEDEAISTQTNYIRFPGQWHDKNTTGLHYNINRFYNPRIGRYINPDPIGLAGGLNLYSYVGNNPINYMDPLGLDWVTNTRFLLNWLLGRGSTNRYYGPGTIENIEMMNSPGANYIRNQFYKDGCKTNIGKLNYPTERAYLETFIDPRDWGSTALQVGGIGGASAFNNGDGTVTFEIPNVAGTHSFFYHLIPDRESPTGPMKTIRQTFQWTEKIDESRCGCK